MRILYVEDHLDTAVICKKLLEMQGHSVRTAKTAAEAKAICEEGKFDLFILDLGLPDADGAELLNDLRQQCDENAKAIAVTGYAPGTTHYEDLPEAFDDYLVKPVHYHQLAQAIAKLETD